MSSEIRKKVAVFLCVVPKAVLLYLDPLTPRVKPWVIQSFLTFDSMNRTLSVTIHWKAVEHYFTVVSILPSL